LAISRSCRVEAWGEAGSSLSPHMLTSDITVREWRRVQDSSMLHLRLSCVPRFFHNEQSEELRLNICGWKLEDGGKDVHFTADTQNCVEALLFLTTTVLPVHLLVSILRLLVSSTYF
jgi:hypothetical protein